MFVGKDVATALGYSNTRDALSKHVDAEDKGTVAIRDTAYETRVTLINESGLLADSLFEAAAGQGVQALGDGRSAQRTRPYCALILKLGWRN